MPRGARLVSRRRPRPHHSTTESVSRVLRNPSEDSWSPLAARPPRHGGGAARASAEPLRPVPVRGDHVHAPEGDAGVGRSRGSRPRQARMDRGAAGVGASRPTRSSSLVAGRAAASAHLGRPLDRDAGSVFAAPALLDPADPGADPADPAAGSATTLGPDGPGPGGANDTRLLAPRETTTGRCSSPRTSPGRTRATGRSSAPWAPTAP